jgi:hypothetical protein
MKYYDLINQETDEIVKPGTQEYYDAMKILEKNGGISLMLTVMSCGAVVAIITEGKYKTNCHSSDENETPLFEDELDCKGCVFNVGEDTDAGIKQYLLKHKFLKYLKS